MQHTIIKFPEQNNLQKYSSLGMKIISSQQKMSRTTITETPGEHTYSSTAATASKLCTLNV
jgi:hypothetical protein